MFSREGAGVATICPVVHKRFTELGRSLATCVGSTGRDPEKWSPAWMVLGLLAGREENGTIRGRTVSVGGLPLGLQR